MFKIKFTTTYRKKGSNQYQLLYYTVEDNEGNLKDVNTQYLMSNIDKIEGITKEDILSNKIIGYHVNILGTLDKFSTHCVTKVLYGYNDLETWCLKHNRQLLKEYRGDISPREISHGQLISVKWQCSNCGRIYESIVKNRTGKGYGCKYCSRQGDSFPQYYTYVALQSVFSDLIYKYNYIPNDRRHEVDIFIPSEMIAIEYDGIAWHNTPESNIRDINKESKLHELGIKLLRIVESNINKIDYINNIIYSVRDIKCENLYTLLKEYIKNKYRKDIEKPEYTKLVSDYSTKKLAKSLQSEFPDIAKHWNTELNGISAEYIAPKAAKFGWFTCNICNTNILRQIHIMTRRDKFKCPVCTGQIIVPGRNDLFTVRNDLMHLWDWNENNKNGLNPYKLKPKTHKECHWKCPVCNFKWALSMPSMWGKKFCNNCGTQLSINSLITRLDTDDDTPLDF